MGLPRKDERREIFRTVQDKTGRKEGFQKPGVDFGKIEAPVIKYGTLRFVLDLVGQHRLKMFKVDAKLAFVNGEVQEELYIAQSEVLVLEGQ